MQTIPVCYGHITPQRLGHAVLGVVWSSSIFPHVAPPQHASFRAIMGGWRRQDIVDWSDAKLINAVTTQLGQTLGIKARPVFQHITRWAKAIPQYHVDHYAQLLGECTEFESVDPECSCSVIGAAALRSMTVSNQRDNSLSESVARAM